MTVAYNIIKLRPQSQNNNDIEKMSMSCHRNGSDSITCRHALVIISIAQQGRREFSDLHNSRHTMSMQGEQVHDDLMKEERDR